MRVAFVSNVVYPFVTGGAEKRIHEIGRRLAADGHDVTVYGRHFWDRPEVTTHEGMTLRAVAPATDLYKDEGRRSITEAVDFAARLAVPLRHHVDDHDVVVASVFPYFPVLSSRLSTVLTDTPLITTWHEVWMEYWSDYLGALAPFGKGVERVTARVPQHPVAVSGVTADRLATIGPSRDSVTVVPNGIDAERINSISPTADGFDVLFVGRLIPDKNVDDLLAAFDRIVSDRDITLGIIGDGPEWERLERQATELGASERITFLGFLDDYEDVLAHMKAATVFASPSTREGFGITYLEAMAADCTVIGVEHPESAASEVIDGAGYLVDPSVESLTRALDRALGGDQPPKDPTDVAAQYDWDAVADQAESVYRMAVDES